MAVHENPLIMFFDVFSLFSYLLIFEAHALCVSVCAIFFLECTPEMFSFLLLLTPGVLVSFSFLTIALNNPFTHFPRGSPKTTIPLTMMVPKKSCSYFNLSTQGRLRGRKELSLFDVSQ